MRTKEISIKHKGDHKKITYVEFDSFKEAMKSVNEHELLKILNYGSMVLAKMAVIGKDPFRPRKRIYKLDITKLTNEQLEALKASKILKYEE